MTHSLKIFVDRLQDGLKEKILEQINPRFLDVQEKELKFEEDVVIQGEVYITSNHLILHLDIKSSASMPCSICNEWTKIPLRIKNFYLTKELSEIPSRVFDYQDEIKEALILEIPSFTECEGKCEKREEISQYLKKEGE